MVGLKRWQLIGLVACALASCSRSPDWDRLEAQGNEIVRAVEAYDSAHSEYPSSLDAAGAHPSKTRWGDWTYYRSGKVFYLSVGDYGHDGFQLYYSPDVGWTRSS
jgi:hypothetical protein